MKSFFIPVYQLHQGGRQDCWLQPIVDPVLSFLAWNQYMSSCVLWYLIGRIFLQEQSWKMNLMFFCKTSKLNNPFLQLQENYFFMNNQTCGILCQVSEQWISPHWSSPPLGVLQSTEWGPSRNSSAAAQPGTQSLSFSVYPVRNDRCPNLSCIKRGTTVDKIMHTKSI